MANKEIIFIPARNEIQLIDDEGYENSYNCAIDKASLKCLVKKNKEFEYWDNETQDTETEEFDYYVIPHVYLRSLIDNNKARLDSWNRKRVKSWLSVEVIDSKNNVE